MNAEIETVEPGKHDREQRERCLIEAATHVFAAKGYDAATTREIAERSGCSEGLIHRYFGGKRGLLMAILRAKSEAARDIVRSGVPDSDDLHDEIKSIMLWSLQFMWEQRDFMRVTSGQGIVDPEIGRFIGTALNGERANVIAEKLRRHLAAGRIRDDVDVDVVAQAISGLSYQSGFFLQVVFDVDAAEVRRMVREIAHVITRGIESDSNREGHAETRITS
jgi:AcrR family transcriptional regulator